MSKKKKIFFVIGIFIILLGIYTVIGNLGNIVYIDEYGLKYPIGFVPWKIGKIIDVNIGPSRSITNAKEATDGIQELFDTQKDQDLQLIRNTVLDEGKYYFLVSYSYKRNSTNTIYDETYIYFKQDIINFDTHKINLQKTNMKEIRDIFNIYYYANYYQWKRMHHSKISNKRRKKSIHIYNRL